MSATVYRCYDADGVLLYVGCSERPEARVDHHRAQTHWGYRIASVTHEEFPNLRTALEAERLAIKAGNPRCNVRSRSGDRSGWTRADYVDYIATRRPSAGSRIVAAAIARMTAEMNERFPAVSA